MAVDASTPHILPPAFFDLALQSNALYPELHRELIERHGMDFKFERTGLKYVIQDDEDRQYAEHIVAQIPHLAEQVRWLDREELRRAEPAVSHAAHGALEFLCDHQVSPFRLADAYLEAARQAASSCCWDQRHRCAAPGPADQRGAHGQCRGAALPDPDQRRRRLGRGTQRNGHRPASR